MKQFLHFSFLKIQFQELSKDPFFKWSLGIASIGLSITLLLFIWFWQKLPPQIPLFYSLPWGEEQLTNPFMLFIMTVGAFVLFWINCFVSLWVRSQSTFYARLLTIGATIISILTMATVIKILLLIA